MYKFNDPLNPHWILSKSSKWTHPCVNILCPKIQYENTNIFHKKNNKIDINSSGVWYCWYETSACFEIGTIELRNWSGIWIMALCCYFQLKTFKTGFIPALFKRKCNRKKAILQMLCVSDRCHCFKRLRIHLIAKLDWLLAHRYSIRRRCRFRPRRRSRFKVNNLCVLRAVWPRQRIVIIADDKLITVVWPIFVSLELPLIQSFGQTIAFSWIVAFNLWRFQFYSLLIINFASDLLWEML